ncbi:hypothetical protein BD289DRAFT_143057 [Coniella lustricola]|uniref:Uncharacterized protein n=1 Tax=Coniella lustricola TaxID=2025994 RepID=A0A2T2ZV45_9PEZI|nr:hypothetical protein BD289DRAFT_143057 [Coniella lustricola]
MTNLLWSRQRRVPGIVTYATHTNTTRATHREERFRAAHCDTAAACQPLSIMNHGIQLSELSDGACREGWLIVPWTAVIQLVVVPCISMSKGLSLSRERASSRALGVVSVSPYSSFFSLHGRSTTKKRVALPRTVLSGWLAWLPLFLLVLSSKLPLAGCSRNAACWACGLPSGDSARRTAETRREPYFVEAETSSRPEQLQAVTVTCVHLDSRSPSCSSNLFLLSCSPVIRMSCCRWSLRNMEVDTARGSTEASIARYAFSLSISRFQSSLVGIPCRVLYGRAGCHGSFVSKGQLRPTVTISPSQPIGRQRASWFGLERVGGPWPGRGLVCGAVVQWR